MTRTASRNRMIALVASTALATLALGGCTTQAAPRADLSAGKAQQALAKGRSSKAIDHAEAAVLAEPRNVSYRAMLGAAYMEAGRFQSAATSFNDALELGDTSPRTALSYALAEIASGNNAAALTTLDEWRDDIDHADLGLALALAGHPERGIHVLGNLIRSGANTPKARQNLAYAYALQGDWRAARIMAAEDVPGDQLDARLSDWARTAKPEDYRTRVASLLSVPVVGDSGQPAALALNNNPGTEQLAAEAAAPAAPAAAPQEVAAAAPAYELPPLADRAEPARESRSNFDTAFAAPAPSVAPTVAAAGTGTRFVSQPVVQKAPVSSGYGAPQRVTNPAAASGTHLVQLGSFSSEASAQRAWKIYTKRYPQLRDHDRVITKAVVRGKTYYRVSAAGFAKAESRSMCSRVKRSGHGCIAWAEGRPLPGAVDTGIRVAAR